MRNVQVKRVRCESSAIMVPKDKAIKRFIVRNIVDSSAIRDIQDACVYDGYALPKLYRKVYYSISAAIHSRIAYLSNQILLLQPSVCTQTVLCFIFVDDTHCARPPLDIFCVHHLSYRDYKIFEVLHGNICGSSITRGAEPTWTIFVSRARIPVGLRTVLGFGGFDARTTMLRCNATVGRLPPCKQACGWKRTSTRIRANSSGSDVSVFRFTLGNEVADQQVARFVGGVGAFLLLLNRLDTADASLTDAQRRAEGAGAWLSACCLVCPAVDERLRQTRRKGTSAPLLRGASNAFVLDRDGDVDASFLQEVAWCTFAVLRCTETKAVLVGVDGRAVLARGLLQETSASERDADRLQEATTTLKKASEWRGETNAIGYLSSAASLRRVGAYEWPLVPTGARSLWTSDSSCTKVGSSARGSKEDVFSITAKEKGQNVALLVYSDVPLPPKQRLWLSLVLKKLHGSYPGFSFNARSRVT